MKGNDPATYLVGTSGYSFTDWVGPFYPPGTDKRQMFDAYVRAFPTVEVNYTFYRMPTARTLASLARRSPPEFTCWLKAHQRTTHEGDRSAADPYLAELTPLSEAGKLAGVLLQFPQSFHRTVANRKYLAATVADFQSVPLAVEFRHRSWQHPSTVAGLRDRGVTLAIPDVPDIATLYHHPPELTTPTGYFRLHSRNADNWYAGAVERYDYLYSQDELARFAAQWAQIEDQADRVFVYFNNCHRGQAAANAEAFRRILGQIQ